MRIVVDIECNKVDLSKEKPSKVWLIVCKDIDTNEYYIFREVSDNALAAEGFKALINETTCCIGHNWLGYDYPVLRDLLGIEIPSVATNSVDTLIISKLVDYSRDGHSIEDYGLEFGIEKGKFSDFSKYSLEMEEYCVRDVDICHQVYNKYKRIISDVAWTQSIHAEQSFQLIVNDLHNNGFAFNTSRAMALLDRVTKELARLDEDIHAQFPSRLKCVREVHPVLTQHGTLHRKDFRWVDNGDLSEFNGGPFCRCVWSDFNPASHKQVIEILHQAGWRPTERTQTYIDTQREIQKIKREKRKSSEIGLDIRLQELYDKGQSQEKYAWKINETNLLTLPATAPPPARSLARRILVESRRRTLTEWLQLVTLDNRIHGKFYGIGAWTHRMAHQAPNTANIPNSTNTQGKIKLYGAEMRALWCAPKNRLLVGVDAEGIQLRIFAHYIDDPEFTRALVEGKKDDKTDPHSLNQKILGRVCKSRAAAKRFIYALLLGAGMSKLAQILECSEDEAKSALSSLLERYNGWAHLKRHSIPRDAKRGYFVGLDGRKVRILGESESERRHLAMSGYLQNGEAVIMKHATIKWYDKIKDIPDWKLVNFVHDEWQTECSNRMSEALFIAKAQCDALREVGEELGLKCPLAGSYYNEDLKDYTIGTNWKVTH